MIWKLLYLFIFLPRINMLFCGDVMQHSPQISAARTADGNYDYAACFEYVAPIWQKADLCVVNMETTFGKPPYSGYPRFNSPSALARAVRHAGADIFLCANNHILDKGAAGLRSTLKLYDSLGVRHVGAYADSADRAQNHPLFIDTLQMRLALLNYTYGTNGIPVPKPMEVCLIDTLVMAREIRKALDAKPDFIICCLHWGMEYQTEANREQKDLEAWLYAHGVDFIVGSHPHVVQPIRAKEVWSGTYRHFTAYSLGNFISNQSFPNTRMGMMVGCSLSVLPFTGTPLITNLHYEWVWTWRPRINGKTRYIVLPVSRTPYNLRETYPTLSDYAEMNQYLQSLRNFMRRTAPQVPEGILSNSL